MPFNYSKLDGLIREKCKTQSEFARKIGISAESLSKKMTGKRKWNQEQILKACEVLGISAEDIPTYFFAV